MLASASRRVVATRRSELPLQAVGGAENPAFAFDEGEDVLAGVRDVLAEDPDALVHAHLLEQHQSDRLAHPDELGIVPPFGAERGGSPPVAPDQGP